jgi:hypothetical protein
MPSNDPVAQRVCAFSQVPGHDYQPTLCCVVVVSEDDMDSAAQRAGFSVTTTADSSPQSSKYNVNNQRSDLKNVART